jgi:hypothetical protein
MSSRLASPVIAAFGASQLALGAYMAIAPRSFFDLLGTFGTYNDHYIRDTATFYLALGVVALLAAGRASWRPAVLAFAAIQYALHTVNHIVDAGDADPTALGVFDAVSLGGLAVVLFWLWRAEATAR